MLWGFWWNKIANDGLYNAEQSDKIITKNNQLVF